MPVTDASFPRQWALEAIDACGAWSLGYTGVGVVVGVVDGGVLESHPDLIGKVEPVIGGCSEIRPNFIFCDACVLEDTHGTLLGGIIAAIKNNGDTGLGWNMVGVAPDATLGEVFIYDDWGGDPKRTEEHVQVIGFKNDCIDVKVHAYDLIAEGGPYSPLPLDIVEAFVEAVSLGRGGLGQVFVWSSGNGAESNERCDYEELVSSRYTIAVGAVGADFVLDQQSGLPIFSFYRASFSEQGASLDCVAPGAHLVMTSRVTRPCSICDPPPYIPRYASCEGPSAGTSFASPHVGGVVAVMEQANPNLSWRDVQEAIVQTAATIDPGPGWKANQAGFDHSYEYGHGLIDAYEAVSFVTGTNGYPAWEPLLGEREIDLPLAPNSVQIGPGQTHTLTVEAAANMRVEHVELLLNITTVGAPGIGPLKIWIDREWPSFLDGPQLLTRSTFTEPRADSSSGYDDALFTSVRHWGETGTATWNVYVRNTSTGNDPVTATWNAAELRFYGTPKCIADWDMDDVPSTANDLAAYDAMHDGVGWDADLDGDRDEDDDDYAAFLIAWSAGCP